MSNPVGASAVYGKTITGSNAAVGVTGVVNATGTLTLSGNAVAAETVTIGGTVYTFIATLTTTGNQVKIAGSASDTIDNLIAAINKATGDGVQYSYNTAKNLFVTAAAGAGDTMVVTAIQAGADGNGIATTETMSAGSWGAVTLTGGVSGALLTAPASGASAPAGGPVTVVSAAVGASGSGSIPIGAKGWTFTVLTGTATFNGVASLPTGFSESDVNTLAVAIAYSTASASSAYVRYNT